MKAPHPLCSGMILVLAFASISIAGTTDSCDPFASIDDPCRFPFLNGWPVQVGGLLGIQVGSEQPPVPVNFDPHDPEKELVLCLNNKVYAWQHNGTFLPGWPLNQLTDRLYRGPAVIDDGNQGLAAFNASPPNYGHTHLYNHQGVSQFDWPLWFPAPFSKSPVWADLNGDSVPEVIEIFMEYLYVWTTRGGPNLLPGFPVVFDQSISGIAVGDVNDDGALEIVVSSMIETSNRWVRVISSVGHILSEWQPIGPYLQVSYATPVLADLDNDGDLEIIQGGAGVLFAWHHDGSIYWPAKWLGGMINSSVAAGDLEGDGNLEIAVATPDTFFLFNADGTNHAGRWPITRTNVSFTWGSTELAGPVIGDLDGDLIQEICFKAHRILPSTWYIVALEPDGAVTTGFPIRLWTGTEKQPTPALIDFDDDGDVDLCSVGGISTVSNYDSVVVAFYDLGAAFHPNRMDWPMVDQNPQRTGCLPSAYSRAARLSSHTIASDPDDYRIVVVNPNPFNPAAVISYQLQTASNVRLQVYDTAGRLLATLVEGWSEAGEHHIAFDGSNFPSGVYLYCLATEQRVTSGKLVLLK